MKKPTEVNVEEEVTDFLEHYTVEYPDEIAIDQTVEALREYVPTPRSKRARVRERMEGLLHHAVRELSTIGGLFWIMNLVFFLGGFSYVTILEGNPYLTLFFLAPIPMLLGLLEVFKGRETGLYEIELSCKYSAQQIMMSRLLIVGIYNGLLSMLLISTFSVVVDNILLMTLLGYWILPSVLVSSLGLFLSIQLRSSTSIPVTVGLWIATVAIVSSSVDIVRLLESITARVYVVILFISLLFLVSQIYRVKRGVQFETGH